MPTLPTLARLHKNRHKKEPLSLGPADEAILRALFRYYYLTSAQVCRLLYKSGSMTYVQTKLKQLADAGYCLRLFLQRASPHGKAPSVFTLSRKGLNYLEGQGLEIDRRYRPSEEREHSYLHLYHTLSVNDFLIACELLSRSYPHVELATILHERDLKRTPQYVDDGHGETIAVIPDAWVDMRLAGGGQIDQFCLAVEIDRGTEEQKKWRRKVRGLLAWADAPYKQRFGTTSLTVAVVATPGEKRMSDLLRWTEAELQELRAEHQADLFRFTGLAPASVHPRQLFLEPLWFRPFDARSALPLIEGLTSISYEPLALN